MPDVGAPELMLVLVIVLLVFGGSKVAEIGGSLGKGIKEFKTAMKEDEPAAVSTSTASRPQLQAPVQGPSCRTCGTVNLASARFCSECGKDLAVTESVALEHS